LSYNPELLSETATAETVSKPQSFFFLFRQLTQFNLVRCGSTALADICCNILETTYMSNFQNITQSPNHPITQSPNHPITQSPNHPITQSPNHPITQSPNLAYKHTSIQARSNGNC